MQDNIFEKWEVKFKCIFLNDIYLFIYLFFSIFRRPALHLYKHKTMKIRKDEK